MFINLDKILIKNHWLQSYGQYGHTENGIFRKVCSLGAGAIEVFQNFELLQFLGLVSFFVKKSLIDNSLNNKLCCKSWARINCFKDTNFFRVAIWILQIRHYSELFIRILHLSCASISICMERYWRWEKQPNNEYLETHKKKWVTCFVAGSSFNGVVPCATTDTLKCWTRSCVTT